MGLKGEIAKEKELLAQIKSIVTRYKRVVAENVRAKEKLAVQIKGTYALLQPHLYTLLVEVVFPLLCLSEGDQVRRCVHMSW